MSRLTYMSLKKHPVSAQHWTISYMVTPPLQCYPNHVPHLVQLDAAILTHRRSQGLPSSAVINTPPKKIRGPFFFFLILSFFLTCNFILFYLCIYFIYHYHHHYYYYFFFGGEERRVGEQIESTRKCLFINSIYLLKPNIFGSRFALADTKL